MNSVVQQRSGSLCPFFSQRQYLYWFFLNRLLDVKIDRVLRLFFSIQKAHVSHGAIPVCPPAIFAMNCVRSESNPPKLCVYLILLFFYAYLHGSPCIQLLIALYKSQHPFLIAPVASPRTSRKYASGIS